jgi:hypothetical protein
MILDHTNPESVRRCADKVKSVLLGLRGNLQKQAATYNRVSPHSLDAMSVSTEPNSDDGLDVRLVSNHDGELWFATGDVQYDTVHGAACGSVTVSPNDDDDALDAMADELVSDVADQLAQLASEGE